MATMRNSGLLARIVQHGSGLYSAPTAVLQVLSISREDNSATDQLVAAIEHDPALTAKVLRAVNCSAFGLSSQVHSVAQAVTLLGFSTVRMLVLGFSLPPRLLGGCDAEQLSWFWRRSLTRAWAARTMGRQMAPAVAEDAFVCGLLADVGMLLLLQTFENSYGQFLSQVRGRRIELDVAERAALGFSHSDLSAQVLQRWCIPAPLCRSIAALGRDSTSESDTADGQERQLQLTLRAAHLLQEAILSHDGESLSALFDLSATAWRATPDMVEAWVGQLQPKVESLADALSAVLSDVEDYARLYELAHQELARASTSDRSTGPDSTEVNMAVSAPALSQLAAEARATAKGNTPAPPTEEKKAIPTRIPVPTTALPMARQQTAATEPALATSAASQAAGFQGRGGATLVADAGLENSIARAVSSCRRAKSALSLLLLELEDISHLVLTEGQDRVARFIGIVRHTIRTRRPPGGETIDVADGRLAVVLPLFDRGMAVRTANEIIQAARHLAEGHFSTSGRQAAFYGGVASFELPPPNARADDLIDAAERCLNSARVFSGGGVKSITL